MNLRQMEVFRAIMHTGSITSAARLLNISQPSVSVIVKRAEDLLRFKLFERRKGGKLEPTPEAQVLISRVDEVFDRLRSVNRTIEVLATASPGHLTVLLAPPLAGSFIPAVVSELIQEDRWEIRTSLMVRRRARLIEALATERADIGFAMNLPDDLILEREEIARGYPVCIFREEHELSKLKQVSPVDLKNVPLIGYPASHGMMEIIMAAFAAAKVPIDPLLEVEATDSMWLVARSGVAVAIVDPFSLPTLPQDMVYRPFVCDEEVILEALTPLNRKPSRPVRALIDLAKEWGRTNVPKIALSPS